MKVNENAKEKSVGKSKIKHNGNLKIKEQKNTADMTQHEKLDYIIELLKG